MNEQSKTLTILQARDLARFEVKVTHEYFNDDEYMTVDGDIMLFDDGKRIHFNKFMKDNKHLLDGWFIFQPK